jgi:hypothetical protein
MDHAIEVSQGETPPVFLYHHRGPSIVRFYPVTQEYCNT